MFPVFTNELCVNKLLIFFTPRASKKKERRKKYWGRNRIDQFFFQFQGSSGSCDIFWGERGVQTGAQSQRESVEEAANQSHGADLFCSPYFLRLEGYHHSIPETHQYCRLVI